MCKCGAVEECKARDLGDTGLLPVCVITISNGKDIETKAKRSFDLDLVFHIEAKWTCLFQNL